MSRVMLGYRPIFERLLDDVAFLWLQRSQVVDHPAYFQWDLAAMDERMQNYFRALLQAPDISWALFEESVDVADAGYFFASAVLAFRTLNTKNIQKLVEWSTGNREGIAGISSALAYLPGSLVHPWIKKFLISQNKHHQYLALSACHLRREDPRSYLTKILQQPDIKSHKDLFITALKLAGTLKRADMLPLLHSAMADKCIEVKFWAAWSCALLKDTTAIPVLKKFAKADNHWQKDALTSLLLLLDTAEARALVDGLSRNEATRRQAIEGCTVLSDASALPWLLQMAKLEEFNQKATQAVVTITGISLENDWLKPHAPLVEENDFADLDEELPRVDPDKLMSAWQQNSARWKSGQRYFLGEPLETRKILNLYQHANQAHRRTAALHLATLLSDRPLLDHARAEVFQL
jgi:uncharacterized protein (TIGR02270 family)